MYEAIVTDPFTLRLCIIIGALLSVGALIVIGFFLSDLLRTRASKLGKLQYKIEKTEAGNLHLQKELNDARKTIDNRDQRILFLTEGIKQTLNHLDKINRVK